MLEGVLVDETIELLFQRTSDFGRSTGTRAIHQTLCTLVGKAIHPFAQGKIRKLECVRDGLEAPAFDDVPYGLGTAEDPSLFRLFQEDISGG